jgi:hypothetical protein
MQLFITFQLVLVAITAPDTVTSSLVWMRALRRGRYPLPHAVFACASLLLCVAPSSALAQQQTAALGADSGSLPDAPVPQSAEPGRWGILFEGVRQRLRHSVGRKRSCHSWGTGQLDA